MIEGLLRKLQVSLDSHQCVQYTLLIGEQRIALNDLIDSSIQLTFLKSITCIHCRRTTKKSFNQGYCYPCFAKLAQCDLCIMKPELCHYNQGTCREPAWGESFCMTSHIVYLANSSGVKVGITRASQIPTRWIDQGASQALPIVRVATRYLSGVMEVLFRQVLSDRTQWKKMLKGMPDSVVLTDIRDQLWQKFQTDIEMYQETYGTQSIKFLHDESECCMIYPVQRYPEMIQSCNFDKTSIISGRLIGIKGQYLMLDTGVLNIRKFSGYHISFQ
ncbi:MAG: DUF2797 domain-containing protein [Endozoicomonadaceae bacterium]|nr:DUF2797 domain-containing protein [Endozoicomonadaceae bacterium]